MAVRVLGVRLRPFFPPPIGKGTWLRLRWRANWLGWALGAGVGAWRVGPSMRDRAASPHR